MIRLAHRVRVKSARLEWPLGATLWFYQCPGCGWWRDAPTWDAALRLARHHATYCPELRRLNRPVVIGGAA